MESLRRRGLRNKKGQLHAPGKNYALGNPDGSKEFWKNGRHIATLSAAEYKIFKGLSPSGKKTALQERYRKKVNPDYPIQVNLGGNTLSEFNLDGIGG